MLYSALFSWNANKSNLDQISHISDFLHITLTHLIKCSKHPVQVKIVYAFDISFIYVTYVKYITLYY